MKCFIKLNLGTIPKNIYLPMLVKFCKTRMRIMLHFYLAWVRIWTISSFQYIFSTKVWMFCCHTDWWCHVFSLIHSTSEQSRTYFQRCYSDVTWQPMLASSIFWKVSESKVYLTNGHGNMWLYIEEKYFTGLLNIEKLAIKIGKNLITKQLPHYW